MKKTLVALAVTAFATSASALTIYDADGTNVKFDGSIRLRMDQHKEREGGGRETAAHTNLHNDGSRFGVTMNHTVSDDLFAFGRLEFRFNGGERAESTDQFGDLYAHRAYVGVGSKTLGEVSFGRQVTIADDIHQAGFDNAYSVFDTAMTDSGKAVVRYDYKAIEGLHVGFDYRFAEDRDADGEVEAGKLKSGYGAGAIYTFDVADAQSMTLSAGYTRDNYKTMADEHHKDAWGAGLAYSIDDLTLGFDYTGHFDKEGSNKEVFNAFRIGAEYAVTPKAKIYANYGYRVVKDKVSSSTVTKTNGYRFMVGSSYQLHKQVFTYVEGSMTEDKTKVVASGNKTKVRTYDIGVGLRVFW